MKRITLGRTGLSVCPIALGSVNYGLPPTRRGQAVTQMDHYLELGGNFLDTAHVYNDWEPGEISRSEKIIGQYFTDRDNRAQWVLSTKGAHPDMQGGKPNRLDPESIREDLQGSLRNLQTRYIDLYFLHRDDPSVPVGEILQVLEDAKAAGDIRHYGCSNWTLPRLEEAQAYAQQRGWSGFAVNQIQWSLARLNVRNMQDKTLEALTPPYYDWHVQTGMALMAYTALAKGYFTKRLQGDPAAARLATLYENSENDRITAVLKEYAEKTGANATEAALRWFFGRPFAAVPVVSCSTPEQLEQVMGALRDDLPPLPQGLPEA